MKTLIVYSTNHGCAEKCAIMLRNNLSDDTGLINLKRSPNPDISDYEAIIIGGSIHAGKIQKRVTQFCYNNYELLKEKKLGLYICCMREGEEAANQFRGAFPEELIKHATATGIFGGEFNFGRMNFIEKFLVKKIAKLIKAFQILTKKSFFILQKSLFKNFKKMIFGM